MNSLKTNLLSAALSFMLLGMVSAQTTTPPATANEKTSAATNSATAEPAPAPTAATSTNSTTPISSEYGAEGLRVNFHGAPLNLVLDYLSDAAGFIINKQADVKGTVE